MMKPECDSDIVIIPAAGSGSRLGAAMPKQYLKLGGVPVICRTINAFRRAIPSAMIVVAISPSDENRWKNIAELYDLGETLYVFGGPTRAESIKNALEFTEKKHRPGKKAKVLVHDAARPLVSARIIHETMKTLELNPEPDGVIPSTPVVDTLRMLGDDRESSATVDRRRFVAVQTPQTFRFTKLLEAYRQCDISKVTDDASVMELTGKNNIFLSEGSPDNFKITTYGDLLHAEAIIGKKQSSDDALAEKI